MRYFPFYQHCFMDIILQLLLLSCYHPYIPFLSRYKNFIAASIDLNNFDHDHLTFHALPKTYLQGWFTHHLYKCYTLPTFNNILITHSYSNYAQPTPFYTWGRQSLAHIPDVANLHYLSTSDLHIGPPYHILYNTRLFNFVKLRILRNEWIQMWKKVAEERGN